jgi:O-antigen/teichoic acid export membrane protein
MTKAAGHFRSHAVALGLVAGASVVGAGAAFVFQIVTARFLGADDFGLLAAFFSIVNVAALGSSALQNSVAVQTAMADPSVALRSRFAIPLDALILGGAGGVGVALLTPVLGAALDASVWIILAAALSIPLSFLLAAYLGRVQGIGHAGGAVMWSTASLVARVALALPALALGLGVGGAVGAVVAATAVAVLGAAWAARRAPVPAKSVFTADGLTVMAITVALAWLTSADVFFLRIRVPSDVAGAYAAVAVLVKASFILPSTLSMYLLPRFVRNRGNRDLTRIGVFASLGLSAATGVVLLLVFAILGPWIIALLYGNAYSLADTFLVPLAVAYIPWIILQGMLIQLTSVASRPASIALIAAVVVQSVLFSLVLPDVIAMLVVLASIGVALLIVLTAAMLLPAKSPLPNGRST